MDANEPVDPYADLPDDPDVEVADREVGAPSAWPLHLRPAAIALVALGGAVGTAIRVALTGLGSRALATPYVTMTINLVGAFLLGLLLEQLARRGPDRGRRQRLRLLLGTGALGGLTTYSSLAVDVASLGGGARFGAAAGVVLCTLVLGALATVLGIAVGSRRDDHARSDHPRDDHQGTGRS